jgi:hypothetical protein
MKKLAGQLGVDFLELEKYMYGEDDMPEALYLRVVDIVLDGSAKTD